jgi:hypothetical protein
MDHVANTFSVKKNKNLLRCNWIDLNTCILQFLMVVETGLYTGQNLT